MCTHGFDVTRALIALVVSSQAGASRCALAAASAYAFNELPRWALTYIITTSGRRARSTQQLSISAALSRVRIPCASHCRQAPSSASRHPRLSLMMRRRSDSG